MNRSFPIPLSVDELMAHARQISGIDFVDHAVIEPLTVLHRSYCEDAGLHEQGAQARQKELLRLLANRLRMQRDFARHPEIADERIKGPVIVYGMARSGTTKTQKVLAASGDFNWLKFWQAYNPALLSGDREESPQARIDQAEAYCRWFDSESPETKNGHAFETHEPEEDTVMAEGSFCHPSFIGYAQVSGYMQWLMVQDPTPMFEFMRDTLKYLQWQGLGSAAKPWLLKAPCYYGAELQLLKVFPDARLVMPHRSPLQTTPSMCKLATCFQKPFCDKPIDYATLAGGFAAMMQQHLAVRAAHPGLPLLDLSFDEINGSIESAVEKIYAHARMPLTAASRQRMRQWSIDNPMHRHGGFRYSLEEFGLSAEGIRRDMADYLALQTCVLGQVA